MADVWSEMIARDVGDGGLLRPARKELASCRATRDVWLEERKRANDERMRAQRACEERIENARASVFAASDGVVGMTMTELEREWRRLAKRDPDGGMMDLWARIAPRAWLDQKRWRDFPVASRVDGVVALASDASGIEAAETHAIALRSALARSGMTVGARLAWRFFDHDRALVSGLLRASGVAAPTVRRDVHDVLIARFPDRPLFVRDVALTASADASLPVAKALRGLWRTGYTLQAIDPTGITLEMPALPSDKYI